MYKHLHHSIINWVSHPFPPNLKNTFTPKPYELLTWLFEKMFTSLLVSHVTCHLSCVTCHMSHVTCQMLHLIFHIFLFFLLFLGTNRGCFLVEDLLSTGPSPSSCPWYKPIFVTQESPKTYFVFTLNSVHHIFLKLFDPVYLTSHLIFVQIGSTVNLCLIAKKKKKFYTKSVSCHIQQTNQ